MNEFYKQWYHLQDTLEHKIRVQQLFIKYMNNIISDNKEIHKDSLLYMIINKDKYRTNDDLVKRLLINTVILNANPFSENENVLALVVRTLSERVINHDNSKIEYLPEYNVYKDVVYKFRDFERGTKEHNQGLEELKQGTEMHYMNNRHHPEHFNPQGGIMYMNLYDVIEMIVDWCAAATGRGFKFKLSSTYQRIETQGFSKEICDILTKNIYLILDKDQIINDLED